MSDPTVSAAYTATHRACALIGVTGQPVDLGRPPLTRCAVAGSPVPVVSAASGRCHPTCTIVRSHEQWHSTGSGQQLHRCSLCHEGSTCCACCFIVFRCRKGQGHAQAHVPQAQSVAFLVGAERLNGQSTPGAQIIGQDNGVNKLEAECRLGFREVGSEQRSSIMPSSFPHIVVPAPTAKEMTGRVAGWTRMWRGYKLRAIVDLRETVPKDGM